MNKWLNWPNAAPEGSAGFAGAIQGQIPIKRGKSDDLIEKAPTYEPAKPAEPLTVRTNKTPDLEGLPPLPTGVKLICYEPKIPPVAIDMCSVVTDVQKFIQTELRDLDSRLNSPCTIRGGWTVPQILDRLRQAGLVVEIDLKGENK